MDVEKNIVMSMIQGFSMSCVIFAACDLDLFELIDSGHYTIEDISEKIGTEKEIIEKLVNVLIANRIISTDNGMLFNTKLSELLLKRVDGSLREYAIFAGKESIPAWLQISKAITNRKYPYQMLNEEDFFNSIEKCSQKFEHFKGMMGSVSNNVNIDICFKERDKNYKYKIVDIGGGTGEIISKFLDFFPLAVGTILDLPHVKTYAEDILKQRKLCERCKFQEFNFFVNDFPAADIYILSRVLHDWSDEECHLILSKLAVTMDEHARLIVIESILPDTVDSKDSNLYMNSLHIWVMCGGRERTVNEFSELFHRSGMRILRQYQIDKNNSVFEVAKSEWKEGEI